VTRPLHPGMRRTVEWPTPQADPRRRQTALQSLLEASSRLSSGVVLRALLFVAIFSLAAVPPLDPDLWWHLANGRLMVGTLSIPHVDVYSFSAAGQPWVMHEWLADLGMFGLDRLGGLPLLVAAFALVVTVTAGCLFWLLRQSGLASTPAVLVALVGTLAGSTAWGARPQLLNALFTALLLIGLSRYRAGHLGPWMLPPFIWLWANLHSGFVAGIIIGVLFVMAEAFDAWRGSPRAMPSDRLRRLALAVAACVPLSAVNPFGVQALFFAVGTLTSPLIQSNIQEWASPDFHSIAGLMMEAIILLLIGGLLTARVKVRTAEWVLALAFLYLAFSSQRHVELFVLAAAPLYGKAASALLEVVRTLLNGDLRRRRGRAADDVADSRRRRAAVPQQQIAGLHRPRPLMGLVNLLLLIVVAAGMVAYRALPNLEPAQEAAAMANGLPVGAASALATIHRPVRIFNYYDFGGYLIWTLYPTGDRVYIDGRVEVYGPQIFSNYLRVNYLASGWETVLAQTRPDAIILPSGHPLLALLERDANWQQFSRDRVATVLTRVGFPQ